MATWNYPRVNCLLRTKFFVAFTLTNIFDKNISMQIVKPGVGDSVLLVTVGLW